MLSCVKLAKAEQYVSTNQYDKKIMTLLEVGKRWQVTNLTTEKHYAFKV